MEPLLQKIEKTEVLRYLGYRGGGLDARVNAQLERAAQAALELAQPRYVCRIFALDERTMRLKGTALCLAGGDIRAHLRGCGRAALMAVTLGLGIENAVRRAQLTDMGYAAVLDACADAAVEEVCEAVQRELEGQVRGQGQFLTGRFSPGYGDMPLSQQRPLCAVLDTGRKIGLQVTGSDMLTPCKSVTAVLGLADTPRARPEPDCAGCALLDICTIRKAGESCGGAVPKR